MNTLDHIIRRNGISSFTMIVPVHIFFIKKPCLHSVGKAFNLEIKYYNLNLPTTSFSSVFIELSSCVVAPVCCALFASSVTID